MTNKKQEKQANVDDASQLRRLIEHCLTVEDVNNFPVEVVKIFRIMHDKGASNAREEAFLAAFIDMQGELPVISEGGIIANKYGKEQSRYALWEDINEAIKPVLTKYKFALSFELSTLPERIIVTGILCHINGHQRRSEIGLPLDTSGSKNIVQAFGSSISYGKRYVTQALLNLTCGGEDDDGAAGGGEEYIPQDKQRELKGMLEKVNGSEEGFLKNLGADNWGKIKADQYDRALMLIKKKAEVQKNDNS